MKTKKVKNATKQGSTSLKKSQISCKTRSEKQNTQKICEVADIGCVKFKSISTKKQINKVIKGPIFDKLHNEQWLLGRGAYHALDFRGLLQLCEVSRVQVFKVYGNNHPTILKQIAEVIFPKLKLLNLYANNISSLQYIVSLNAPGLEELYLGNNKIHTLLPLRKCSFPVLKILGYQQNRIKDDCACLTELKSPILTNLQSQMFEGKDKTQGQYNFNWVVRIQSSNCNMLKFDGIDRIKRHKNYLRVHKRFDFLQWDI